VHSASAASRCSGCCGSGSCSAPLAAAIISLSRGDIDLAHNQRIRAEAQLAADSAARVAIYALVNRADSAIAADGSIVAWRQPEAEVRLQVTVEDGRLDLNHYRLTPAGLSACCSIY